MNAWITNALAHHGAPIMVVAVATLLVSMGPVSAQERQPVRSKQHCDASVASTLVFGSGEVTSLTAELVTAAEGYPTPGANYDYTYPPAGALGFYSFKLPYMRALTSN